MDQVHQLQVALHDRYKLERPIGAGGMATVFLATDIKHHRQVALKVLSPELGAVLGPERFLAEIRVTANLQHPHLLPLFDSGEVDGMLFYVMPFIEGETLRARLERERQLPVDEAVGITTAIAGALDYAHRHGVIHRDLKPENILLHDGQPLIADFGIALAVSNAGGNRITQTGLSLGTPQYMSPEQATGDRTIDGRTDIYSLGALAYEMLTGDPPHTGSTSQAIIARLMTERPRSIRATRPSVPLAIEAAVEKALEKLPADRWATAREFAEALSGGRVVPSTTTVAPVADARISSDRVLRRSRILGGTSAVIAVIAIVTAAWSMRAPRAEPPVPGVFTIELPDSVVLAAGPGTKLALSRDGRQMVLIGASGGQRSLYLRRLEDPIARIIPGTEGAFNPGFSPDGKWIHFNTNASLYIVPTQGGIPKAIVDSANASHWGDNGTLIFVRKGLLGTVTSDGGKREMTPVDPTSRKRAYTWPELLPGGAHALVALSAAGGLDSARLGVIELATGKVIELGVRGTNPHFITPDRIAFGRSGGDVYVARFSLRKLAVEGEPSLLLRGVWQGGGGATGFFMADNGSVVYHEGEPAAAPGGVLVKVDEGGREQQLNSKVAQYKEPRISPDGKLIAMRVSPTADRGDLWIMDVATGAMTRLTSDSLSNRNEWMPDGRRVVFISRSKDTVSVVARYWDQSGSDSVVAHGVWNGKDGLNEVALGPITGYSAFRIGSSDANSDIGIAPTRMMDQRTPVAVAQSPATEREPRVSPDGTLLAYVSHESGSPQVYLTTIPKRGARILVSVRNGSEPMWAPDGKRLFYRGEGKLFAAQVATKPTLAIVDRVPLFADPYHKYDWHQAYDVFPDGKHFLFVGNVEQAAGKPSTIRLITNWPQYLEQQKGVRDER